MQIVNIIYIILLRRRGALDLGPQWWQPDRLLLGPKQPQYGPRKHGRLRSYGCGGDQVLVARYQLSVSQCWQQEGCSHLPAWQNHSCHNSHPLAFDNDNTAVSLRLGRVWRPLLYVQREDTDLGECWKWVHDQGRPSCFHPFPGRAWFYLQYIEQLHLAGSIGHSFRGMHFSVSISISIKQSLYSLTNLMTQEDCRIRKIAYLWEFS